MGKGVDDRSPFPIFQSTSAHSGWRYIATLA